MRSWLVGMFFALACLFLDPGMGLASEAAEGEEKRSMFEQALDLGIWTLVVFLLLVLILSQTAWKWMLEGLAQREANIASAVEEAKQARDEAAQLRQVLQEERQRALDEVKRMLEEARNDANRLRETMKADADKDIAQERQRLQREIAQARDQALQEIWNQAAQVATVIASKAVRRQLTLDDQRGLVDEALNELQAAANKRQRVLSSVES